MANEKDAHYVATQARLAARQRAAGLHTDLEAVQQELADTVKSCATATETAATLQAELKQVEGTVSSLEGQLEAVLQDLAAEQHRHQAAVRSPFCTLQVKIGGFPFDVDWCVPVGVCWCVSECNRHQTLPQRR